MILYKYKQCIYVCAYERVCFIICFHSINSLQYVHYDCAVIIINDTNLLCGCDSFDVFFFKLLFDIKAE